MIFEITPEYLHRIFPVLYYADHIDIVLDKQYTKIDTEKATKYYINTTRRTKDRKLVSFTIDGRYITIRTKES